MRLGIDTGGTYTDAVLLDARDRVLAAEKALTSHTDLFIGIDRAVRAVLAAAPPESAAEIALVGLSTTLATNALVEGRGARAGLVLIGLGRETLQRGGLAKALADTPVAMIAGGHDAAGEALAPLDLAALDAAVAGMEGRIDGFAVTGAFAVRNAAHEQAAGQRIGELTGLPVTLSSELASRLDAPRRALTTLLNARLVPVITRLIEAVERLLAKCGIAAPLMVVRGDGSLMAAAMARLRPVETLLSGPAASVVGAAHLSGLRQAVVSDVGGTTTDVAILEDGRPRLRAEGAVVGGHRTMVEAIDLSTTGLGGDSEVGRDEQGRLALGPRRVVPLSLLAMAHPHIVDGLMQELDWPLPRPTDGRLALRLEGDPSAGYSRSQTRLLELLADGPRSLLEVVDREHLAIPLASLLARGSVALAGFTPSDAAHVLSLQTGWSVAAARAGAALEARRQAEGGTAEALAEDVLAAARTASAEAVVSAAWGASGGRMESLGALRGDPLLAAALAPHGVSRPLALRLGLDRPIVAVGGPAALLYDGVAERLATTLVLPAHFRVANAIGAVVGDVVRRIELVATRSDSERLALHLGNRVVMEADVETARATLTAEARAAVLREAVAAGAIEPVVSIAIEEDTAVLDGGRELVMEIRVSATARGRPAASGDAVSRSGTPSRSRNR